MKLSEGIAERVGSNNPLIPQSPFGGNVRLIPITPDEARQIFDKNDDDEPDTGLYL